MNALQSYAEAKLGLGLLAEAEAASLESLLEARTQRRGQEEAESLWILGRVKASGGALREAIITLSQARNLTEEGGALAVSARLSIALGTLYSEMGRTYQAREFLESGLRVSRSISDLRSQAYCLALLGSLHAHGDDPTRARGLYQDGLSIARRLKDEQVEALLLAYIASADTTESFSSFDLAKERLKDVRELSNRLQALNSLGSAALRLGRFRDAEAFLSEALTLAEERSRPLFKAQALHSLARVDRGSGRLQDAWKKAHLALEVIEDLRLRIGGVTSRASFAERHSEYYEFAIDLLLELEQQDPGKGYAARAFETNERSKALDLLDALAQRQSSPAAVDPALLLVQEARYSRTRKAYGKLLDFPFDGSMNPLLQELEREIESAERLSEAVEVEIEKARWGSVLPKSPFLRLEEVQTRVLSSEELLLEYRVGRERSYLWVVSREAIHAFILPPSSEISNFTQKALISEPAHRGLEPLRVPPLTLASLGEALLGPARGLLNKPRLVVIPDGALWNVPFGALSLPGTSGVTGDVGTPLLLQHEIARAPSASSIAAIRKLSSTRQSPKQSLAIVVGAEDSSLRPRLPGVEIETTTLMRMVPGAALFKFRQLADGPSRARLNDFQILHFVTQAFPNRWSPAPPGGILSVSSGTIEGLYSVDLADLSLRAQLAVLSGCDTARSRDGDGSDSMTGALLRVGVSQVVGSLWAVDDFATSQLMIRFYQSRRRGRASVAALREAQLEMYRSGHQQSPYYWAGFVVDGDWR